MTSSYRLLFIQFRAGDIIEETAGFANSGTIRLGFRLFRPKFLEPLKRAPRPVKLLAQKNQSATDEEALAAFQLCTRTEGIIPALEPAHALAHVTKRAPTMGKDAIILMNLCGRGDKDIFTVADHLGVKL